MMIILGGGLFFLALISLIMPWVHLGSINELREELKALKRQQALMNALLENQSATLRPDITTEPDNPAQTQPMAPAVVQAPMEQPPQKTSETTSSPDEPPRQTQTVGDAPDNSPKDELETAGFERALGTRLPAWIGGAALALAGFFMVKYSLEKGLLSPMVRIIIGGAFGLALLIAANWLRRKPDFGNGASIAQALSGAGVADLYFCTFAATSLYDLVPSLIGFALMAAITTTAVTLSLRHGAPIALLGLVGGFLTPALIGSQNPQAAFLFIYLYFVIAGLMVVIRKNQWWWIAIPTVLGAFLWVCTWLYGANFTSADSISLGLFLLAVSATVVAASGRRYEQDNADVRDHFAVSSVLNYLTLGGSIVQPVVWKLY